MGWCIESFGALDGKDLSARKHRVWRASVLRSPPVQILEATSSREKLTTKVPKADFQLQF